MMAIQPQNYLAIAGAAIVGAEVEVVVRSSPGHSVIGYVDNTPTPKKRIHEIENEGNKHC